MMERRKVLFYSLFTFLVITFLLIMEKNEIINISHLFSEMDQLKNYILSFGLWSPVVFFIIQTLQVIIAPIPGNVTGVVSGAVFGITFGFVLSGVATILGSCIAFLLAKKYGKPLVKKLVNDKMLNKYDKLSSGKITKGLFLLFLIPFVPDDILCFIVGLSGITLKKFMIIVIIGRLPGTLSSVLIGAGLLQSNSYITIFAMVIYVGIIFISLNYNTKLKQFIE